MQRNIKTFGDCTWAGYNIGKHEFTTVVPAEYKNINGNNVEIYATEIFINGMNISNDTMQELINIYIGRMKKIKKLNRKINEIKEEHPDMYIYKAIEQAEKSI